MFLKLKNGWKLSTIRGVSSFSTPLETAFNGKKFDRFLNKRRRDSKGLFEISELTRPEGFRELKENCITASKRLVEEACNSSRTRILTRILDDLSDELCRVADLAEFLRIAHPDPAFATSAEDACLTIGGLVEQLNTHRGLYDALETVVNHGDRFPETEVDKHVGKLFLADFRQSGIHLDVSQRKRVVDLNHSILELGQAYSHGAHAPSVIPKADVPVQLRPLFYEEGDQLILGGLHIDSPDDFVREISYKLYYRPRNEQEELLENLLKSRFNLTRLCGYDTYAHRALEGSLGRTPEAIHSFLQTLSSQLRPLVNADYASMASMKSSSSPFQVWDVPYFIQKAKRATMGGEAVSEAISEYLSLGACMEGLNTICKKLFNVEFVIKDVESGEIWHEDVCKIAVKEEKSDEILGHIYCDFFSRPGKPYQDSHFTIRGGRVTANGDYQNPIVVLMLNFPKSTWTKPTLLTPSMVDNLFHEMGHALHSMLARTKYQHVTGTRCSTDFAEVPSTLMEYFASDSRVLKRIGRHYKTGEPIPDSLLRSLCVSKALFLSVDIHTQLFYSMVDQMYHGRRNTTVTETLKDAYSEYHVLEYVENTAWHHRFSHLVGYGGRYYSYLMSKAVASTIWKTYFEADPFDSTSGIKFRNECLAHGGGKPSYDIVSDFIGQKAKSDVLTNALMTEIDAKRKV